MSEHPLARQPKIIVIRGNSGSGKSSTARILQGEMEPHTVLIEQDYFRRKIVREKERLNEVINPELMLATVKFGLKHGRDVIIEGILPAPNYSDFLKDVIGLHPNENYFFYFDIPFEETLHRHQTKPNAHEFGEKEMREWFREHDTLDFVDEVVIGKDMPQNQVVKLIQTTIGV